MPRRIKNSQAVSNTHTVSDTELKLVGIKEGSAAIAMSESWLRQQHVIPFVRIGRRKLFRMSDLVAFVEKNIRS